MTWEDRRKAQRMPCSLAVRLREPDGKYRLNWLFDISPAGVGAFVVAPVEGEKVYGEIVAAQEDKTFPFEAELIWANYDQAPPRIGLHFKDPSPGLQSWLDVLHP